MRRVPVTTVVRKALVLATVLAGGLVAACAEATLDAVDATATIRERRSRRFERAALVKPRMEADAGLDPYLAPLLYLERNDDAGAVDQSDRDVPGTVSADRAGRLMVDVSQPAVYFADTLAEIGERPLRQITFVWFRQADDDADSQAQGLRVTFDEVQQPALIEVFADASGARVVFVSERLEAQAAEVYGAAGPEQSYAVERPGEGTVVVAGTFGVGPIASGPIAYLPRDGVEVSQVHCRCEPSQVGDIDVTIDYELLPLGVLNGLWPRSDGSPSARDGWGPPDAAMTRLRVLWTER